jgi:hypothetical protein
MATFYSDSAKVKSTPNAFRQTADARETQATRRVFRARYVWKGTEAAGDLIVLGKPSIGDFIPEPENIRHRYEVATTCNFTGKVTVSRTGNTLITMAGLTANGSGDGADQANFTGLSADAGFLGGLSTKLQDDAEFGFVFTAVTTRPATGTATWFEVPYSVGA